MKCWSPPVLLMFLVEEGLFTSCSRQSFPIVFFHLPFLALGWIDFQSENCIKLRRVYAAPVPKIRFICVEVFFNWSEPNWIYFPFMWTELSPALVGWIGHVHNLHVNPITTANGIFNITLALADLHRRLPLRPLYGNVISKKHGNEWVHICFDFLFSNHDFEVVLPCPVMSFVILM